MASGFSLAYRFSSIAFCWSVSDDLRKVCVNVGTTSRTMGSFFAKYLAISFIVVLIAVIILSFVGMFLLKDKPVILQGQIEATESPSSSN